MKTTPVVLENITYADAKAGNVEFAAVVKNPETSAKPLIRVSLQSDATKRGEKAIVVVEQTLKIVMSEPREVRPSIPTEDRDAAMVRLRSKVFEVRMTRGGKPVANHPFRLWIDYVEQTGGHDHGDTRTVRRTDNDDNYGYFVGGQTPQPRRPLDDVTDANGRFEVTYHASIFGDSMRIYLQSRDLQKERFFKDSVTVVEKVAGLINFRTIASEGRWIFAQTATGETRHPNNNWCTQEFADSIRLAIEDFYEWTLSDEGGGRGIAVSLNDMSLPLGGRFDMSGRWDGRNSQRHLYHRVGTSVDVNQTLTVAQLRKLTRLMARRGLERNAERPEIHYGSDRGN